MKNDQSKKKKSALHIAMSILVAFSLFIPSLRVNAQEGFVAGQQQTLSTSISVNQSFTLNEANIDLPIDTVNYENGSNAISNVYYYVTAGTKQLNYTRRSVYAYKYHIESSDLSVSLARVSSLRIAVGNADEIASGKVSQGSKLNTGATSCSCDIWYVNDNREAYVYLLPFIRCYDVYRGNKDTGTSSTVYPNVNFSGTFSVTITPYSEEDYLSEIYDELVKQYSQNSEMIALLTSIRDYLGQNQAMLQTYLPYLSKIFLQLSQINDDFDVNNDYLNNIYTELSSFHQDMITQTSTDKNVTDGFKQDSNSQSSELNNLNQQAQADKIDINSASGSVDQNLDLDVDANYGVLLSTFTNNKNILTMLLAVSSMALISYVLFGKR